MKLLTLSAISFMLISTTALSFYKYSKPPQAMAEPTLPYVYEKFEVSTIPILKQDVDFPVLSAQGVIAVDLNSSVVLYEKNPDLPLLPASTTKIMTAMVASDYYSMDEVITVTDPWAAGQKMNLVPGERITVENLLYGLLVYSANDAAEVLANNYPGGREVFIEAMNLKAKQLGLDNTNFENPSGLDSYDHVSTARDLVRLSEYAMRNNTFAKMVNTKSIVVKSVDQRFVHNLTNINQLLGEVEGVLGVKTGWTENARENLVTYIKRGDKKIMLAILGSQDRFGETTELAEWVYSSFEWKDVDELYASGDHSP